ncbi:hypothetical protein [Pseudomonas veronii]|jgi:hypothetical protein|uniref:Uncharacterized protein n=1 Tax=Pseudomonas veronii TaxID=76761 RepID=A0A5M8E9W3_PSEVE|nr:hypothetical protein [Pseudomonas veronii]KAA6168699.1 hypothetical protein F3K53_30520 [Pseudomonas veronii]KAA6176643.1 hypothetical protein F3K54_13310 [Pseudomonas veronii]
MKKKKRKAKYHPFETLRPTGLDPKLEEFALRLYDFSTKGSESIWEELPHNDVKTNSEFRKRFLTLSHAGMSAAQQEIIELVDSKKTLNGSEKILMHGIADAMAWQLIGNQLCYARRFYKNHKPVDLKQSNFQSVVSAASERNQRDPGSFSLISDLTSFVQVGDLLTMGSGGGLSIAEVKEGQKNHELMQFMDFFSKSGCPRAFQFFAEKHGESGIKQLQRMLRQTNRMGHVGEILSKGHSRDPDTNHNIYIPEETVFIGSWAEELNGVLDGSDSKGWALDVVEDCLFVASYAGNAMRVNGHGAFNLWFDNFGGTSNCPRATLIDTLRHPLALPIFNWHISEKHKFDILFGRKNVCVGLNVPMLLEKLQKVGLQIREATNKEFSQAEQQGFPLARHNGKGYFVGNGEREMQIMDGIFLRVLFHCQRPVNTIQAILEAPDGPGFEPDV